MDKITMELIEIERAYDAIMFLADEEIMDDEEKLHYKSVLLDKLVKDIRGDLLQ